MQRTTSLLEGKFDLPQFALLGPEEIKAIQQRSRAASAFPFNASVIFHVSAVGFNRDGIRALVYVGHDCGSLWLVVDTIYWSRWMDNGRSTESTMAFHVRGGHNSETE